MSIDHTTDRPRVRLLPTTYILQYGACGLLLCLAVGTSLCWAEDTATSQPIGVGDKAVFKDVEWVSGGPIALEPGASGKILMIDVFAGWCPHCAQVSPLFTSLNERYGKELLEKHVAVIGVSEEPKADILAFKEKLEGKLNHPLAHVSGIIDSYGITGVPTALVVDQEGVVLYVGNVYQRPVGFDQVLNAILTDGLTVARAENWRRINLLVSQLNKLGDSLNNEMSQTRMDPLGRKIAELSKDDSVALFATIGTLISYANAAVNGNENEKPKLEKALGLIDVALELNRTGGRPDADVKYSRASCLDVKARACAAKLDYKKAYEYEKEAVALAEAVLSARDANEQETQRWEEAKSRLAGYQAMSRAVP